MKAVFPILDKGEKPTDPIPPPAPVGNALFYTARWQVWRVGGVPTLFERRMVKVRDTEQDRPRVHHYDTVPIGPVMDGAAVADCGIDTNVLADAREAVREHARGLT